MKTFKINILSAAMAVAVAIAALIPQPLSAAEDTKSMKAMKGGEHMVTLNKIETKQDIDALKAEDTIAMVCAKCKTVWVTRMKDGVKGAQLLSEGGQPKELIGTHACAGCKSTLTVVGHAKGQLTELKHSCKACGDDSAFCCATKPGTGAPKGVDKEKK